MLLIFGRMVAGRTSLHKVVLRWLVAGCICLPLKSPLKVLSGELLKSMGMLVWSVAVLAVPVPGVLQTVERAEFYWPCHLGIDNFNVGFWIMAVWLDLCL